MDMYLLYIDVFGHPEVVGIFDKEQIKAAYLDTKVYHERTMLQDLSLNRLRIKKFKLNKKVFIGVCV